MDRTLRTGWFVTTKNTSIDSLLGILVKIDAIRTQKMVIIMMSAIKPNHHLNGLFLPLSKSIFHAYLQ